MDRRRDAPRQVYFNHFLPFAQRQFNAAAKRIFPDAGSRRKNFTRRNRDGRSPTVFGKTGEFCVLRRCFSRREDGAETTGQNASSQNKKTSSGRSPPLKKRRSTRRAGKFAEAFGRNVGPDRSRPAPQTVLSSAIASLKDPCNPFPERPRSACTPTRRRKDCSLAPSRRTPTYFQAAL